MLTILDLVVDVLDGCIHSCAGCHVIKKENRDINEQQINQLIQIVDSIIDSKEAIASVLNIGPTDIFISSNTKTTLKQLTPLMDQFNEVGFSSTLSYKTETLIEMIAPIKEYLNGRNLRFTVPLHPRNVRNRRFHQLVDRNIEAIEQQLPDSKIVKLAYQVNVMDFDEGNNPILNATRSNLTGRIKDIDIAIPEGRGNLDDINQRMKLRYSLDYLKQFHLKYYKGKDNDPNSLSLLYKEGTSPIFNTVNGQFCTIIHLLYSKGRLFMPSFYGEEVVVMDDRFSVPLTPNAYSELQAKLLSDQLQVMDNECANCSFNQACLHYGTIALKDFLKEKECILPKENLIKYRHQNGIDK